MQSGTKLLEVIAASIDDALEAERGGAGRIELVRALSMGGLTPDLALVGSVSGRIKIPMRVMIRESDALTAHNAEEFARLEDTVDCLKQFEIQGLVFGFVRHGEVEVKKVESLLQRMPDDWRVTFHRAFESIADQAAAVDVLKRYPQIDRILTTGADSARVPSQAEERRARIEELQRVAGEQITILVAGGQDLRKLRTFAASPTIRELHVGRAARLPASHDGVVCCKRVAAVKKILEGTPVEG
jgi:copper homeostasis protein